MGSAKRAIWIALIGGLMLLATAPAEAQRWRFSLTPFAGGYIPTKKLGQVDINVAGVNTSVDAEMKTGAAFGAKIGFSNGGRFGMEAGYFYASSKTRISIGLLGREDKGTVQGGLLRATFRATDGKTDTDVIFAAGLSGQSHTGDALRLTQNRFDVGGSFGAGLRLTLSPQVAFRLNGDANVYSWSPANSLPSASQLDLLVTAGLELKLGR